MQKPKIKRLHLEDAPKKAEKIPTVKLGKTSVAVKKPMRPVEISPSARASKCSYCKHIYWNPCEGKNKACGNKIFLDSPKQKRKALKPKRKARK